MTLKTSSKEFITSMFRPFCLPMRAPITKKFDYYLKVYKKFDFSYKIIYPD